VGWLKLSPLGCVPDDGKLENPRDPPFLHWFTTQKKNNICRKGGYVVLKKSLGEKKQSVKLTYKNLLKSLYSIVFECF
jgi:hypothetical protein